MRSFEAAKANLEKLGFVYSDEIDDGYVFRTASTLVISDEIMNAIDATSNHSSFLACNSVFVDELADYLAVAHSSHTEIGITLILSKEKYK